MPIDLITSLLIKLRAGIELFTWFELLRTCFEHMATVKSLAL